MQNRRKVRNLSGIKGIFNRFEGSRTIKSLYILTGAAAAIGLVSGIGSTCTTFDSRWWKLTNDEGGYTFAIIGEFQLVYILSYIVTWLVAIAWGVLFWALMTRKAWFSRTALITSIAGFLSGFFPAAILLYEWYMSYGVNGMMFTPSWFRTLINAILLIILLIPGIRHGITAHMKEASASVVGSVGSQVAQFAYVLFGFGIIMMLQPFVMPTHIIDGVNIASSYGDLLASGVLQFFGGLVCILLGAVTRIFGYFLNTTYSTNTMPSKG
ncbi:MAG: hypothetical protein ACFE95_13700 [Candidatus Hodarchaeota archaeon]